ncbi:hypothetical protein [Sulfitobacter sp. SK012]|uniref:hypothetical protein n=1 Tax=Sulfitobacter sp. SK012 TaxID=1389005 RepID=UPI0013B3FDA7|nr:hypothetical protein [Sulfitobacter sp. SK012]
MTKRGLNVASSKSKASVVLVGMFAISVDGVAKMLVFSTPGTAVVSQSIRRRVADAPLRRTARSAS